MGIWQQVYDPFHNAGFSTLAAALPIISLLAMVASNKVKAHIAAVIAVILLSEPLSWVQVTGGAAIALALVLSRMQQKVPQEPLAD